MAEIKIVDDDTAGEGGRVKISLGNARLVVGVAGQLLSTGGDQLPSDEQIDDAIGTALRICSRLSVFAEVMDPKVG